MRRFSFRFEKILMYRRHQEKERQRNLAVALSREDTQRREIARIIADREEAQDRQKQYLVGAISAARLTRYARYYLFSKQMELTGRETLKLLCRETANRRQALVEAARQKKIYEKLKERHWRRFTQTYNQALQKENDDIGQKIFIRNQ